MESLNDPSFVWVSFAIAATHLIFTVWFCQLQIGIFWLFFAAYVVGGTFVITLLTAMHECVHYASKFPGLRSNCVGLIINIPLGMSIYGPDRYAHFDHHSKLGTEADYFTISAVEAQAYESSKWRKLIWLLFRPLFTNSKRFLLDYFCHQSSLEIVNCALCLA